MTVEERKAKLQEIKEKVESWHSSLTEMLEYIEIEYKKISEELKEAKEKITPEEMEIVEEIGKVSDIKIFEFVDKWDKDNSQPSNEKDIEILEGVLINICKRINEIKDEKKSKQYEADEKYREYVDKKEEELEPRKPYKEKLLFIISRHYEDKKKTSSSSNKSTNSNNKNTTLPWTLAIIFGIIAVISTGVAIYFFWHQRKIKKFKV